jgi:hypothetical protein
MADKTDVIDLTGLLRPHYLLHPSTVLLIASDLFPLAGIAFWHWDTFLLLMLYWMDTAIIAFWTIARIATTPRDGLNDLRITSGGKSTNSPWAVSAFFVVHCGVFTAVHFLFLWVMFSGAWSRRIHGPGDFVQQIIVENRLWLPLAGLMLSRGVSFLLHVMRPGLLADRTRAVSRPPRTDARPGGERGQRDRHALRARRHHANGDHFRRLRIDAARQHGAVRDPGPAQDRGRCGVPSRGRPARTIG